MKKTNIYMSDNISCTTKIACEFAKSLKENCIIYLNGDMGSGKTLFTSKQYTVRNKSGKDRGNYGESMGIADTVVIPRLKYGTMV